MIAKIGELGMYHPSMTVGGISLIAIYRQNLIWQTCCYHLLCGKVQETLPDVRAQ